jgi:hypothetical protein
MKYFIVFVVFTFLLMTGDPANADEWSTYYESS